MVDEIMMQPGDSQLIYKPYNDVGKFPEIGKRSLLRFAFKKIGFTFDEIKFQGKWKQRIKQHRNPPSRA